MSMAVPRCFVFSLDFDFSCDIVVHSVSVGVDISISTDVDISISTDVDISISANVDISITADVDIFFSVEC